MKNMSKKNNNWEDRIGMNACQIIHMPPPQLCTIQVLSLDIVPQLTFAPQFHQNHFDKVSNGHFSSLILLELAVFDTGDCPTPLHTFLRPPTCLPATGSSL